MRKLALCVSLTSVLITSASAQTNTEYLESIRLVENSVRDIISSSFDLSDKNPVLISDECQTIFASLNSPFEKASQIFDNVGKGLTYETDTQFIKSDMKDRLIGIIGAASFTKKAVKHICLGTTSTEQEMGKLYLELALMKLDLGDVSTERVRK